MTSVNIPIQCMTCGATGSVGRVTANLQCRCGSTDLDLWDGEPTVKEAVVAPGNTGWGKPHPDHDANWSDYEGPKPGDNPRRDQKNVAEEGDTCQICNGTGSDPRASGAGYEENVCRNCHGTGKVTTWSNSRGSETNDATVKKGPQGGASDNGKTSKLTIQIGAAGGGGGGSNYVGGATVLVPSAKGNQKVSVSQADKIMSMASVIVENNSGLSTEQAFELARRAVTAFPEDVN